MRLALPLLATLLAFSVNRAAGEMLLNNPVYNPETRSYFELFSPDIDKIRRHENIYGLSWLVAKRIAQDREFHGVKGRLAVIKSQAVSEFLKETFKPDMPAWIGLRYWCRYRRLQWVTGELWKRGDFSLWGKIWDHEAIWPGQPNTSHARCPPEDASYFLGVHYWSREEGFYWNANGKEKHFQLMFVEYPTGKP